MHLFNLPISSLYSRFWGLQKADQIRLFFIIIMQLALAGALFWSLFAQSWLTFFVGIIAFVILWLPPLLAKNFHIHFPLEFELLLNIFIYGSIFLGEIHSFYTRYWWWDIVLHTGSGIALGFIGFLVLYSLYQTKKIVISPFLLALFSFCFALALGALWEIFEFFVDMFMGTNMQKNGLTDTMWDLVVDAVGAFIVSVSGYLYITYHTKGVGIFDYYIKIYFDKKEESKLANYQ